VGFQNEGTTGTRRKATGKGITIVIVDMQKEIDMDLRVRITESQYEALKSVAEASGDSLDEWIHSTVMGGIQSDIDLYFGKSESIKEKLYKQVGDKDG
jgi:hypothetical protein